MWLSNDELGRRGPGGVAACALGLAALALALPARVRADDGPIDAYARWVAYQGRWAGPTVAFPDAAPRPAHMAWAIDSEWLPLRVHGGAAVEIARGDAALRALERAYDYLVENGWPVPFSDGGRGGSLGFDLYLVDGGGGARVEVDVSVPWAPLDAATSWAAIDATAARRAGDALDACATATLAEAALFGQDPAEDAVWRRATGAYVAYLATGRFGCDDDAVATRQRAPELGWSADPTDTGAGTALWLAMLSEREGGAPGAFVRETWQLARQKSEGARLRGSPHFAEALARALQNAGESLEPILQDLSVARYFAGDAVRRAGAPYAILRALPSDAAVPLVADIRADTSPKRVALDPPLRVGGSAYVRVAFGAELAGTELPVWLAGQPGVRWSLAIVKFGADGREIGRIVATPRNVPKSYVPVLLEPGTHSVLLVVSALPEKPATFASASDAEHDALLIVGEAAR